MYNINILINIRTNMYVQCNLGVYEYEKCAFNFATG